MENVASLTGCLLHSFIPLAVNEANKQNQVCPAGLTPPFKTWLFLHDVFFVSSFNLHLSNLRYATRLIICMFDLPVIYSPLILSIYMFVSLFNNLSWRIIIIGDNLNCYRPSYIVFIFMKFQLPSKALPCKRFLQVYRLAILLLCAMSCITSTSFFVISVCWNCGCPNPVPTPQRRELMIRAQWCWSLPRFCFARLGRTSSV